MQQQVIPNFFIVGAPKCGTTAMNDYLAQHPDIFMAKKEIHFFGSDVHFRYRVPANEYNGYFENAGNKKIIGEASVWYLYSAVAANEIKAFSPAAKILIMLRNPVEVLHSMHSQHLYDGNEDVPDFETALSLDPERKKGNRLPSSTDFTELPPYIDSVLFAGQVKRYLDVFGEKNVKIILYEDFVKDTAAAVTDTLEFLGVNSRLTSEFKVINPNKRVRFFFLHRLIRRPSPAMKKLVRTVIPFKKLRYRIMLYLFHKNIILKKRDKMSPALYAELVEKLSPDVQRLGKIIGRDLSAWHLSK